MRRALCNARRSARLECCSYLFNKIEETLPIDANPIDDFRFKVVSRFADVASGKLRYEENEELLLSLNIPKNRLRDGNAADHEVGASVGRLQGSRTLQVPQSIQIGPLPKPPRKCIELSTLIESFASVHLIEGYVSPITHEAKGAHQSFSLGTFPKFLLIQVRRPSPRSHNADCRHFSGSPLRARRQLRGAKARGGRESA